VTFLSSNASFPRLVFLCYPRISVHPQVTQIPIPEYMVGDVLDVRAAVMWWCASKGKRQRAPSRKVKGKCPRLTLLMY
jgi:hypothetical protein